MTPELSVHTTETNHGQPSDPPLRADQLRGDVRRVEQLGTLRALLAIGEGQLLEARVGAQRREVRTGIERGEVVKACVKCFLQRSESFLSVAASRIGRTQPEIVDARRSSALG